jgi:CO/xanthine dehydrogenase FAD-binding subunit
LKAVFFDGSKPVNETKYWTPQSLKEAIVLLREYQGQAGVLAGGTDVLARIKKGQETPEVLINIEGIHELNYIDFKAEVGLCIGALTPLSAIEKSPEIQKYFPVLANAAGLMASPTIRSRATIGGNLGNAAPSADIAPSLLVLGASILVSSMEGEKVIPLDVFFTGPGSTALQPGQIISGIRVPLVAPGSGAVYLKQKRREGADLAVAGVAAMVTVKRGVLQDQTSPKGSQGNIIEEIKIALGAVAPTPIRARQAENLLRGKQPSDDLLEEAGRIASAESQPINDIRSSAEYRRKVVAVLTTRAVRQALEQAAKEELR